MLMRSTMVSSGSLYKIAGLLLISGFLSVVNAATTVTISDEAAGNNATGRAIAATLDDAWISSLPSGAVRPNLFSATGTYTGFMTFFNSVSTEYRVDWQVGYIADKGPGTPTSTTFVNTTSGTVTKNNTSTVIQGAAPKPFSSEFRLSTGYSAPGDDLNAIKFDFKNSPTDIYEFGIFVGDLESRLTHGTAGRVIVFDEATNNIVADAEILYTGTVNTVPTYTSDEVFPPSGNSNNNLDQWGNNTTAFISVKSDQPIGEVIIHVGDDDHTTSNNGTAEQLGLAGFQIPDSSVVPILTADISVSKTLLTTGTIASGQTIEYRIVVTNSVISTTAATNVAIEDLPTNLIVTSATGPNSSCSISPASGVTTSVNCAITSLAVGATETITLQATVP